MPTQARAVQEKENAKKAAAAPKPVPKAVLSLKRALYVARARLSSICRLNVCSK
jgi:hypothetical protein